MALNRNLLSSPQYLNALLKDAKGTIIRNTGTFAFTYKGSVETAVGFAFNVTTWSGSVDYWYSQYIQNGQSVLVLSFSNSTFIDHYYTGSGANIKYSPIGLVEGQSFVLPGIIPPKYPVVGLRRTSLSTNSGPATLLPDGSLSLNVNSFGGAIYNNSNNDMVSDVTEFFFTV